MNRAEAPIHKAMVLAAGFGLRARPLTLVRPKPLFPVLNRPLIGHVFDLLARTGIGEMVVNAHHLADRLVDELTGLAGPGTLIISREETILGTGGGLWRARPYLDGEPFLVINADVYTDLDLEPVLLEHADRRPLATLVLHDHPRFNQVRVDPSGRITGFRGLGRPGTRTLAFTGIHVIEPEIFRYLPEGPSDIVNVYQNLIDQGRPIRAFVATGFSWWDAGALDAYLDLNQTLCRARSDGPVVLGQDAVIHADARVEGWAVLGAGVRIEKGARIRDSILWPGARVAEGIHLDRCVAADGAWVRENAVGQALVPHFENSANG
jgi:mannose-1-phosphate guanylyltransferase